MATSISKLADCVGMPVHEFVLHREPMLLLETVAACTQESAECEWQVNETDAFFIADAGVPTYVGIEHMAQCVAAHAGARARVEGFEPPLGFLLGTRRFTAMRPYFELAQRYKAVCIELFRDSNGLASYECSVQHGDETITTARISVVEKERGRRLS